MHSLHPDVLDIADISQAAAALADLLDVNDSSTLVPTCGEWTLADLVWHLCEVQSFWAHVIDKRPVGPETYQPPARPADDELAPLLRSAGQTLANLLAEADPEDEAWSWSDDQTVGFSIRRQVHESMIHGIDGFLAVGAPLPDVAPRLAADGIDEMVRVMLTGRPDWAAFEPEGEVLELVASDTGDRWALRPGRIVGTDPASGNRVERDGYGLMDGATPAPLPTTNIGARALDLLLWMWGRQDIPATTDPAGVAAGQRLRRTFLGAVGG